MSANYWMLVEIREYLERLFPKVRFEAQERDYGRISQIAWEYNGRRNAMAWPVHRMGPNRQKQLALQVLRDVYPGTVIRVN